MPIAKTRLHAPSRDGFALVVIAALFVAFAVIGAVAVERNTTVQLITRRDSAADQLTRLSNAIIEYAVFNQVGGALLYPCPARLDLAPTDSNFGKGVDISNGYAQDCSNVAGDVAGTPVTTISGYLTVLGGAAGGAVVEGMVPIQTLSQYGLGVNDAFDPWNNRILYVVNRKLTKGASPVVATEQANNPTVSDVRTGQAYAAPDFILISLGRDGVGGIRRDSTTVSIACTNGTTKPRLENCDNDTSFNISPTYTAATAGDTTYFDDILSFYRQ